MTDQAVKKTQPGPEALASSLLTTLEEEYDALVRLRGHFDDHILALRRREKAGIEEAANRTNDEVNLLARLKQTRDRKMRLLGRVLQMDAEEATLDNLVSRLGAKTPTTEAAEELRRRREAIRREALRTRQRCRDLEFALEYAVHLGRDLLHALHGAAPSGSTKVYTSHGGTKESSGTTSFVNKVG